MIEPSEYAPLQVAPGILLKLLDAEPDIVALCAAFDNNHVNRFTLGENCAGIFVFLGPG
jgi:hypothetical protein